MANYCPNCGESMKGCKDSPKEEKGEKKGPSKKAALVIAIMKKKGKK